MNIDTSLESILSANQGFGELFYEVFFEANPDAKAYFKDTDMKTQSVMLLVSLRMIGDYQKRGFAAIEQYLRLLGTRHSKRSIPQEMYPKWRDSLLVALERFHKDDWNGELADEWRAAIDAISVVMFKGYSDPTGV